VCKCVQAITRAETQGKAAVSAAHQELQQTKDQLAVVQERLQKVRITAHLYTHGVQHDVHHTCTHVEFEDAEHTICSAA
jgi:hypothetical protein